MSSAVFFNHTVNFTLHLGMLKLFLFRNWLLVRFLLNYHD